VIGTSALGSLQLRASRANGTSSRSSFSTIVDQLSRAPGEVSVTGLPGTPIPSLADDHHFDVEDSRSNWQPASTAAGLTSPTEQLSEAVFGGVQPSPRLGIAEPFLSLSARARN
jgi:hypothetical protein